ncbi:hypothetical protein [Mesorhizobium sp.]|uniref:hypothetical protein n=1 Tax=Mesorhizobium sp. TaxID=1871066 RepID=UPI0025BD4D72|nr:hypothetical protein [Mesorhizobium sp.]
MPSAEGTAWALWLFDRQGAIAMGLFSDLNKKLTENLYAHGSYLSDPSATCRGGWRRRSIC